MRHTLFLPGGSGLFGRASILMAALGCVTLQIRAQSTAAGDPTPQAGGSAAPAPGEPNAAHQPTLKSNDSAAALTPEQSEKLKIGVQAFRADRYADALPIFRELLPQLASGTPTATQVAKYAAEAAVNLNDAAFALRLLKPIEDADPNDWQTAAILAHVYAETGQKEARDAELTKLIDLHRRAVSPQIGRLQQILLERIPVSNGSIRVWYSLEPWGNFKTYIYCRIYDQSGRQISRVTLESSDFDQPLFEKERPDLAARGERRFSLDGYSEPVQSPDGGTKQTHSTYGFFDGQPSYDTVRERVVAIAEGQVKAYIHSTHQTPAQPAQ